MTAQANAWLLVWHWAKLRYNPQVARAEWCARVLQCVQGSQMISELLGVPFHGCQRPREQPWLSMKFYSKPRKWREISQFQTHPGAVWGVSRENIKRSGKKLISDRIQEPKPTTVCSGNVPQMSSTRCWDRSSDKCIRLEAGWCHYKEQGEAFKLADVLLIFTSPSGMTLIICS